MVKGALDIYSTGVSNSRPRSHGAGDALVGAFLLTWVHTNDLAWSTAIGSAVASFVVENVRLQANSQIEGTFSQLTRRR